MNIKGIEIDFDFYDAENMERFEKYSKELEEKCDNAYETVKSPSEAIKKECEFIDCFIDNVFGEGLSLKIFKGKYNLKEHILIFQEIMNEGVKSRNEVSNLMNRYAPRDKIKHNSKKGRN